MLRNYLCVIKIFVHLLLFISSLPSQKYFIGCGLPSKTSEVQVRASYISKSNRKNLEKLYFHWFLLVENGQKQIVFSFSHFMALRCEIQEILLMTLYRVGKIYYKMTALPNQYSRTKARKSNSSKGKYWFSSFNRKRCHTEERST